MNETNEKKPLRARAWNATKARVLETRAGRYVFRGSVPPILFIVGAFIAGLGIYTVADSVRTNTERDNARALAAAVIEVNRTRLESYATKVNQFEACKTRNESRNNREVLDNRLIDVDQGLVDVLVEFFGADFPGALADGLYANVEVARADVAAEYSDDRQQDCSSLDPGPEPEPLTEDDLRDRS